MDQIVEITAFVRTVERGSQAGAARQIGVTPAMVGRSLRALEERLGTRLLHRSTATQSLTEAGALFFERASAVLDELAAAEAAVTEGGTEPGGTVRLSAPVVFGARYLAPALARLGTVNGRLAIDLTLNDRRVDLVEEGFDLALRIGRLADTSLVARRLAPCRLIAVAAPSYLRRRGGPAGPEQLAEHDCLIYAYAGEGRVVRFHGADGRVTSVRMEGRFTANNGEALNEAAIAGAGIVISPTFIAGDALRDGRLVPVLPGWTIGELGIFAVFPTARHLPAKVRACVDWMAGCFGEQPAWDAGLDAIALGRPIEAQPIRA